MLLVEVTLKFLLMVKRNNFTKRELIYLLPSVGWAVLINKNKTDKKVDEDGLKWLIVGAILIVIYAMAVGIAGSLGKFGLVLQITLVFVLPFGLLESKNKEGLVMPLLVAALVFYGASKLDSVQGRAELCSFLNSIGVETTYYKEEQDVAQFRTALKDAILAKSQSDTILVSKATVRKTLSLGAHDGFRVRLLDIDLYKNPDEQVKLLSGVIDTNGDLKDIEFGSIK